MRKAKDSTLKHLIAISINVKPNFKDVLLEIRFGKQDEQYSSYMQDFPSMKAALLAIQLIGEMYAQTAPDET